MHQTLLEVFRRIRERSSLTQADLFGNSKKKESQTLALDEILEIYESSWIDDWFKSKKEQQEYKERGKDMLKKFHQEYQNSFPIPLSLEQGFNFKLGEYTISGRIDRIDPLDGKKVELIDYKTGSPKKEEKIEKEDKEQLLLYQIASKEVLGLTPEKLTYYYLDDGSKVSFLGTDEDIEEFKQKFQNVIEKIRKGEFDATPNPWKCEHCDFRDICDFRAI